MTATLQPASVTIGTADAGPLTLDLLRSDGSRPGPREPADLVIALHGFPQASSASTSRVTTGAHTSPG